MIEITEGKITIRTEEDGRIFRRTAMRLNGTGQYGTLVGELKGIRAYVREREGQVHVILTDEDLYE